MPFFDPTVITSAGASGGGLSSNAQDVIGGLGSGLLGGLGNLFPGSAGGTTTKTTSNSSGSSTPTYSTAVLPLYNQLLSKYMDLSKGNGNFYNGYQSQGQQQINNNAAGGKSNIQRLMAQNGQLYSPSSSTALVQNELNRQNQMATFNNSIPLLQHQDTLASLGQAGNFFSSLPTGQSYTQNGSSTQDVTKKPTGGFLSGILGGVAQALPSLLAL